MRVYVVVYDEVFFLRYFTGFTLRTTRCELFLRVAISEYCDLTVMVFFLSALMGAPSAPRKAFLGVADLLLEAALFSTPFRVCEFVDSVGFFQIVGHCAFQKSLAFLAYLRMVEIDLENVRCVKWIPYKGNNGGVQSKPERQVPRTGRDREGIFVTEIFSRVDVIYR